MQAAITSHPIEPESKEEPTLKVILSALWNLSAHCKKNKVKFYCNFFVPLPTFFFLSTIWRHHVLSQCLKITLKMYHFFKTIQFLRRENSNPFSVCNDVVKWDLFGWFLTLCLSFSSLLQSFFMRKIIVLIAFQDILDMTWPRWRFRKMTNSGRNKIVSFIITGKYYFHRCIYTANDECLIVPNVFSYVCVRFRLIFAQWMEL